MIHKYGSHIFHTNNEKVWEYLKQFTDFNTYMHKVVGIIDGIEAQIPFNFHTLYEVFPETMAKRLAKNSRMRSGLETDSFGAKKEATQKSTAAPKTRRSVRTKGEIRPPTITILATGAIKPQTMLAPAAQA